MSEKSKSTITNPQLSFDDLHNKTKQNATKIAHAIPLAIAVILGTTHEAGCVQEHKNTVRSCNSLSPQESKKLHQLRSEVRSQIKDGNYKDAISTAYDAELVCHSAIHEDLIAEVSSKIEEEAETKAKDREEQKNARRERKEKARREAAENKRIWEESQKIEEANKAAAAAAAEAERKAREERREAYLRDVKIREDKSHQTESSQIAASIHINYTRNTDISHYCTNRVGVKVACDGAAAYRRYCENRTTWTARISNRSNKSLDCTLHAPCNYCQSTEELNPNSSNVVRTSGYKKAEDDCSFFRSNAQVICTKHADAGIGELQISTEWSSPHSPERVHWRFCPFKMVNGLWERSPRDCERWKEITNSTGLTP